MISMVMTFLMSTIGRYVAIAGLTGLVLVGVHVRATMKANALCEAKNAAAIAKEIQRQSDATKQVLEDAENRALEAENSQRKTEERLNAYLAEIEAAGDVGGLSQSDVERLRDILKTERD